MSGDLVGCSDPDRILYRSNGRVRCDGDFRRLLLKRKLHLSETLKGLLTLLHFAVDHREQRLHGPSRNFPGSTRPSPDKAVI